MSTTITPTEQNIEINVNNDVIDINVTNEIVDVNATTQQIDINVAGAYPIPNPVLSVFGRTGEVVATEGDYSLTQLGDVTLTSPSNGQVLKYNGTAWVNGLDAGGITTLNTLTALSQTFATGTSGSDFNISSATATHTFNLPTASATNRGALSSADWTTFNSKQNALTNPITGTGTSGQVAYWNGTNTQTGSNNLFWDATNNRLGINKSTPGVALSNYQNPLSDFNSNFCSLLGIGWLVNDASKYAAGIANTNATGHGLQIQAGASNTSSRILTLTNGTGDRLIFNAAGNLMIGTSTDAGFRLDVNGTGRFQNNLNVGSSTIFNEISATGIRTFSQGNYNNTLSLTFNTLSLTNTASQVCFKLSTGGLNINTIQSGGGILGLTFAQLQLQSSLYGISTTTPAITNQVYTNSGSGITVARLNLYNGDNGKIEMQPTGGNVLIGTTTDAGAKFQVSGSTTAASAIARGVFFNNTLVAAANNDVLVGLDINPTFTNGAFTGVKNLSIRVGNSYGPYTSALGHGVELNTNVGISGSLDVGGDSSVIWLWRSGARANGYNIGANYVSPNFSHLFFGSGGTKQMLLVGSNGNLILQNGGTFTDAGFRLDVNGTARVQSTMQVATTLTVQRNQSVGDVTLSLDNSGGVSNWRGSIAYRTESGGGNQRMVFNSQGSDVISIFGSGGRTVMGQSHTLSDFVSSAVLNLVSTTYGFLPPRMTTTQKNAIVTPAPGLMVYDTTLNKLAVYTGAAWETVTSL
jgi:hypothetical protein